MWEVAVPAHRLESERRYYSLGESLIDAAIGFFVGLSAALIAFMVTLWVIAQ